MPQPKNGYIRNPSHPGPKAALTCVVAMGIVLGTMLPPASAATEVRGRADEMQLRAENASIREVLDALSGTFKLRYKLPPNSNRVFTGLYSGSLQQVLSRILDGHDYIVNVSDGGIEVVVLSASGASPPGPANLAIEARENPVITFVPTNEATPPSIPPLSSYLSNNAAPQP